MHPVLGTMMPEICEAPHLQAFSFHPSSCSVFYGWGCVHLILLLISFYFRKECPLNSGYLSLYACYYSFVHFFGHTGAPYGAPFLSSVGKMAMGITAKENRNKAIFLFWYDFIFFIKRTYYNEQQIQ